MLGHSNKILEKHHFLVLQGSVETLFRWGGKHHNCVVTSILPDMSINNYENRSTFDGVIWKIERMTFLWAQRITTFQYAWQLMSVYKADTI